MLFLLERLELLKLLESELLKPHIFFCEYSQFLCSFMWFLRFQNPIQLMELLKPQKPQKLLESELLEPLESLKPLESEPLELLKRLELESLEPQSKKAGITHASEYTEAEFLI